MSTSSGEATDSSSIPSSFYFLFLPLFCLFFSLILLPSEKDTIHYILELALWLHQGSPVKDQGQALYRHITMNTIPAPEGSQYIC